jgi:DNA-binding HxlR family transcriptional regulator
VIVNTLGPYCPQYAHALAILERRWSGAVVRALLAGLTRFGDIQRGVPGLSAKLLAERLKDLEAEGLVTRTVHPETPVRIVYGLTDKGRDLAEVVEALQRWATKWVPEQQPEDGSKPALEGAPAV